MESANLLSYLQVSGRLAVFFRTRSVPNKLITPFLCSFWKESIKTFK